MESGFIAAYNIYIAYQIHNPEKANTIFFIHGNSSSSGTWRKQVISDLLAAYRLITIDLPNHGHSGELAAEADFSLPSIAKIISKVIKELTNGKPFIVCGVSLGTNIVVEMLTADFFPKGLLLAGSCIAGEGFGLDKIILPGADASAVFAENVPEEQVNKYAGETSISTNPDDRVEFLKDYHEVKGFFRSTLYSTIAAGNYNDEIVILQKTNCPVCIVFGKEERVVNTEYLNNAPINLWNKTIYKIPGSSHLVNIDAPEAFNELLAEFSKAMFTTNVA